MLAAVCDKSELSYDRDFRIADNKISNGCVETTTVERKDFLARWCGYTRGVKTDPYLIGEDVLSIVRAVSGFSGRVRRSYYGRGHQFSCARVQVAVRAIGQTCEMDLVRNPLYRAPNQYLKPLEVMFAGYRKEDPLPMPEISIPVGVPEQIAYIGLHSAATQKEKAVGDWALISFYYILCMGEYTQKRRKTKTHTVQFRMCDIAFKRGNTIIPHTASVEDLMSAIVATLRLSNQKMVSGTL